MSEYNKIFNIKTFHVLQDRKTRLWSVKVDSERESIATFQTKEEAVEKAMEIIKADRSEQKRLVVHKPGGRSEKLIDDGDNLC